MSPQHSTDRIMRSFSFASALFLLSILRIQAFAPSMPISTVHATSRGYSSMNTSRRYANTLDGPGPRLPMTDFSKRMRNIAVPKKIPERAQPVGRPSNVMEVTTLQDYKKCVADEKDRIVVVRFYAGWCRACKAVAPSFYQLAREFSDKVKFVEVPVTGTSVNIHQGLGVPSIPFGHVYIPEVGLVEELRMSRSRFPIFANILKTYVEGSCATPDFDYSDPFDYEQM